MLTDVGATLEPKGEFPPNFEGEKKREIESFMNGKKRGWGETVDREENRHVNETIKEGITWREGKRGGGKTPLAEGKNKGTSKKGQWRQFLFVRQHMHPRRRFTTEKRKEKVDGYSKMGGLGKEGINRRP